MGSCLDYVSPSTRTEAPHYTGARHIVRVGEETNSKWPPPVNACPAIGNRRQADEGSQGISVTHSSFMDTSGSAIALGNVSRPVRLESLRWTDWNRCSELRPERGARCQLAVLDFAGLAGLARHTARTHRPSGLGRRTCGDVRRDGANDTVQKPCKKSTWPPLAYA